MSEKIAAFSDRLKEGMTEKGMTARKLSKLSGLSESIISNYRAGRFEATQVNLQKLAESLDVSLPWLMGYDVPIGCYNITPETQTESERLAQRIAGLTESQRNVISMMLDAFVSDQ